MEFWMVVTMTILAILIYKPKISIFIYEKLCSPIKIFSVKKSPENTKERKSADGTDLFIYFGSQTGTSEGFAKTLQSEALERNIKAKTLDLEEFNKEEFLEACSVVFIVSTYGEGDPTESAESFYEWLSNKESQHDNLSHINFTVFGCGNTQYEFYNKMGKQTFRRMCNLKAKPFCRLGLGDDDDDIEENFNNWKKEFWPKICNLLGKSGEINTKNALNQREKRKFKMIPSGNVKEMRENSINHDEIVPLNTNKKHSSENLEVISNYCISSDNRKWHCEFKIGRNSSFANYEAGETLCIAPRNSIETVEHFCKRFCWEKNLKFRLEPAKSLQDQFQKDYGVFSREMTIGFALKWFLDITRSPTRSFIKALIPHMKEKNDIKSAEKLLNFGENNYKTEKEKLFKENTIIAVLERFKSVQMDFGDFVEMTPRLQMREYTISSSRKFNSEIMTITYSLIKSYCGGEKEAGNPLGGEGVCTDYLKALKPTQKIAAVLKKSTLVLPDDLSGPILMIGVGSGLAPFRGFIQEGNHAVSQGVKLNNWCLFFGCRNKETDYIYREELERAQGRDGCLTNLIVAYSRAGPEKIYVQNLIEENSQIVWSIVRHPKSRVFICGSTAMGRSSKIAIQRAVAKECKAENGSKFASGFMQKLTQNKRIINELWG